MQKAVFLDRDGVINKAVWRDTKFTAPFTVEEFELYDGVIEALKKLKNAGYLLVVTTNQPDIATGEHTVEKLNAIHQKLAKLTPIDDFRFCPHVDKDACHCRKPKAGMLTDAAKRWGIDLKNSYMVGDRWRDVDAGKAAGCTTIWIQSGYDERVPDNPDYIVRTLSEAADIILKSNLIQ